MQFAEGDIISCLIDPDQLSPSGGYMDVPTAPGLGIVMNHDVLNLVE
jgi:L-alanine-DL-glutamate epimerase-like enolase superfamily enzyme